MTDHASPLQRILARGVLPPTGPLTSAVRVGSLILISGVIPFNEQRDIAVDDFPAQMRQVMENLRFILHDSGSDFAHVAKLEVQMIRPGDFGDMNRIYGEYFEAGAYPARVTTMVKALPVPELLVQVHGMAVVIPA